MITLAPAELKIPFAWSGELDGAALRARLTQGELRFAGKHEQGDLEISEWRADDGPYAGTLRLVRPLESGDLGCAIIEGPRRLELAQALVNAIAYVPADLLHLAVRTSPSNDLRRAALRVLRILQSDVAGAAGQDSDYAATLDLAVGEVDFELRRRALEYQLEINPALGRRRLEEALSGALFAAERDALEALGNKTLEQGSIALDLGAPARLLRFAFPIFPFLGIDEIIKGYSRFATVEERGVVPLAAGAPGAGASAEGVGFRLRDSDTRMMILLGMDSCGVGASSSSAATGRTSRIGGVYFWGPASVDLAMGAAQALSYFPRELADQCSRWSDFADFRARGALALRMAEFTP